MSSVIITPETSPQPCFVCSRLRGDANPKPDARYCEACGKWFCDGCRWTLRRLIAAGGLALENFLKFLEGFKVAD